MLTPAQYKTLVTLTTLRLPAAVDAGFVSALTSLELATRMPTSTRTDPIARWLVDAVLRHPTPVHFITLVEFANDQQEGIRSLVILADKLRVDPSEWAPLVTARLDWTIESDPLAVSDGRPFVDRRGFRELLPRPGVLDTPACILVTGETQEGKSYLHDFCRALTADRQDMRVGYARIPTSGTANSRLRTIADRLALDLDVSFDSQPDEHPEPERDAENLATWIAHYTVERPIPAIAILDEFGRPGVSPAHHKFVAILGGSVQNDCRVRDRLRLVLIDYDRARLVNAGITPQHYVLEPIEAKHVEGWLRVRHPGQPDYRYENAAHKIIARLASLQPSDRMEGLNNLVRAASQTFGRA